MKHSFIKTDETPQPKDRVAGPFEYVCYMEECSNPSESPYMLCSHHEQLRRQGE